MYLYLFSYLCLCCIYMYICISIYLTPLVCCSPVSVFPPWGRVTALRSASDSPHPHLRLARTTAVHPCLAWGVRVRFPGEASVRGPLSRLTSSMRRCSTPTVRTISCHFKTVRTIISIPLQDLLCTFHT